MKSCSPSAVSACPQLPAMRLHNGSADGQPHAAALRLGGKERGKDLIYLLRWQAHARVTYRELELTVLQFRLHRKLSAGVLHGFDGVEHEVHEHLLQLHTVDADFGHFGGGKLRAHGYRVSRGLTFEQREHFLDNSVHVDQFTLWKRLPVEGAYTVDDFSRTASILHSSLRCPAHLVQIWLVALKPAEGGLGTHDYRGDGLLDLVCQRRGHFPQHAHTIDVRELGL